MQKLLGILLLVILCACSDESEPIEEIDLPSVANAGELDLTFGDNGVLIQAGTAGGSGIDEIYAVTIDSQDRVIAVGRSVNSDGNFDMVAWRLDTDGELDRSFNGNGIFSHNNATGSNSTSDDFGYDVAVNSNDEIIITGASVNGTSDFDMVVWKLTVNGNLDVTFNTAGVFTHNSAAGGNENDQGRGVHVDSSGNIWVAGTSGQSASNTDMAVWKLSPTGSLDTNFSGDGIFTHDGIAGGTHDIAQALTTTSDGDLIVVGRAESASNLNDMAIWKLDSSGNLDTSFNSTGLFTHNGAAGANQNDEALDFVIDSNNNLYVTGASTNLNGDLDMTIWKLTSSGTLDTSFDEDGIYTYNAALGSNDTGSDIIIDSSGNLVVAGSAFHNDLGAWRITTSGAVDTTFNTDGFFAHDSAAGGFNLDGATGIVEDSNQRLILGGWSENNDGNNDASFWRLR